MDSAIRFRSQRRRHSEQLGMKPVGTRIFGPVVRDCAPKNFHEDISRLRRRCLLMAAKLSQR